MRGLRIIPFLVVLLVLVYYGVGFVEANSEQVVLTIGPWSTAPTRLGFVVMTSTLLGVLVGATLASTQVVILYFQNRSLRKRVGVAQHAAPSPSDTAHLPADIKHGPDTLDP